MSLFQSDADTSRPKSRPAIIHSLDRRYCNHTVIWPLKVLRTSSSGYRVLMLLISRLQPFGLKCSRRCSKLYLGNYLLNIKKYRSSTSWSNLILKDWSTLDLETPTWKLQLTEWVQAIALVRRRSRILLVWDSIHASVGHLRHDCMEIQNEVQEICSKPLKIDVVEEEI
jgi:hypothetical protein